MRDRHYPTRYIPKDSRPIGQENGLGIVFVYEKFNQATNREVPYAIGYRGRANKPAFHYSYRNPEARELAIKNFFDSLQEHKDRLAKWAEERKAKRELRNLKDGDYIGVVETATLLRKVLKAKFPNVKFSVRSDSYSMGASIDVAWEGGPEVEAVKRITNGYEGSDFDGMIDLKFHVESWLWPDGSASFARSHGTTGSRGVFPAYDYPRPDPGCIRVHFGCDSVSLHRKNPNTSGLTERTEVYV